MRHRIYHYKGLFLIFSFFLFLFILFFFINPREIVDILGVQNSYLVLFCIALLGGVSSLTSSSYYAAIVTFTISGLNPFIMAFIAGIGLTLGDLFFYLLGSWGRNNISGYARRLAEKYSSWLLKKPKWVVQTIIYIYTGFSPLPVDILMVILSFARFPYKSFIFPLFFGNITLVLVIAFGVLWGVRLI